MREDLLNELGFPDPYINQKKRENEFFLGHLAERFDEIDKISDSQSRWEEVIKGVLAGNVFDWGAKAVTDMFDQEAGGIMQFSTARDKLQRRPWLIDDFEQFYHTIGSYKCVCVFADNSGADIVLGIIPFVRELLRCGMKVKTINSEQCLPDPKSKPSGPNKPIPRSKKTKKKIGFLESGTSVRISHQHRIFSKIGDFKKIFFLIKKCNFLAII